MRSKGAMIKTHSGKSAAFPDDLENIPLCAVDASDLNDFEMCPFSASVTYKGNDVTGSTWGAITLPEAVWPNLGIQSGVSHYAWINPGFGFSDFGGFVYRGEDNKITGANRVCTSEEATTDLKFLAPVDVPQMPSVFSVGRMYQVGLESLREAGAKRFTWVQKEEGNVLGVENMEEMFGGGFLYEGFSDTETPRLIFFAMAPPNATETPTSGGTSATTITIQVHVNPQSGNVTAGAA